MTYRADFSNLSNNDMMEHLRQAILEMERRVFEEGQYLSSVIEEKYSGGKSEAPRAFTRRVQDGLVASTAVGAMAGAAEKLPTIIGEGPDEPA